MKILRKKLKLKVKIDRYGKLWRSCIGLMPRWQFYANINDVATLTMMNTMDLYRQKHKLEWSK